MIFCVLGCFICGGDYFKHTKASKVFPYSGLDLHNNMELVRNETDHYNTQLFSERAEEIISRHDPAKVKARKPAGFT